MKAPITPARLDLASAVANSAHSVARSLSTRPERQMASVRGRTSFLMKSLMLATTAIGGGGGVGGGVTETPPSGGGGGAANPLSQITPSAILPEHGSMRAYLRHSARGIEHVLGGRGGREAGSGNRMAENAHKPVDVLALGGDQDAALVVVSGIVERFAVEARPVRELAVGVGRGLLRPERVHATLARVADHRERLPNNTPSSEEVEPHQGAEVQRCRGAERGVTHLERRPRSRQSRRALALATGRLGSGKVEDAHVGAIGRELDASGIVARVGCATAGGVSARKDGGPEFQGLTSASVLCRARVVGRRSTDGRRVDGWAEGRGTLRR